MRDIIKAFGILLCKVKYNIRNVFDESSKIEFLFLRASYGNKHWSPPKGLHENGEGSLDTAIRETFEETGLNKDKYKLLNFKKTLKYKVDDKPKETTYYLAILLNENDHIKLSDEHTEYKWINKNELDANSIHNFSELLISAEEFIRKESKEDL